MNMKTQKGGGEKNAKNFGITLPEKELRTMEIVDRRVYERIWKTWRINQKEGVCCVYVR